MRSHEKASEAAVPDESERPKSRRQRPSFEAAFTRLEETVQKLESGGLTLDEATRLYEEGMRLARQCNELLSATEMKVTRLQTSYGQQMQMVNDDADSDDGDDADDAKN